MAVTTGFNHVATLTADLDRTKRFYAEAFDAEVTFEMAARRRPPAHGDHRPRRRRRPQRVRGPGRGRSSASAAGMGGRGPIDHYALAVDSLDVLEGCASGSSPPAPRSARSSSLGPEWSLFFRDPDGMELEVCCAWRRRRVTGLSGRAARLPCRGVAPPAARRRRRVARCWRRRRCRRRPAPRSRRRAARRRPCPVAPPRPRCRWPRRRRPRSPTATTVSGDPSGRQWLVPVPIGCDAAAAARRRLRRHAARDGHARRRSPSAPRTRRPASRSTRSAPAPSTGYAYSGLIDVRYGIDAKYLDEGEQYLVGASVDPVAAVLVSKVREPEPDFGGDEVIGASESDVNCPELADPVRTTPHGRHADRRRCADPARRRQAPRCCGRSCCRCSWPSA